MLNFFKNIISFSLGFLPRIKPVFFILTTLLYYSKIASQNNLINNGSFEEFSNCSCYFDNNVNFWYQYNSSDYFNMCSTSNCGIPLNDWGFINAKDGQAMIGQAIWINNSNSREFIYTKIDTLLAGHKYCLSYYVAHAQCSGFICKDIQALFTDEIIGSDLSNYFDYQPQILNSNDFTDFGNWYKIEGNFIANGTEHYLYIGNFIPFELSDCFLQNSDNSIMYNNGNYVYLDDVVLTDCTEYIIPNVLSPNNDGINDLIDFSHNSIQNVEIINRWGNLVFQISDSTKIWDGSDLSGGKLNDGVYFYKIYSNNEIKTGIIHLVR